MDDATLSRELGHAARQAIGAKHVLEEMSPEAPGYRDALIAYLRATVLHLAIVSVAQARQYESLAAEVDELREEVAKVRWH